MHNQIFVLPEWDITLLINKLIKSKKVRQQILNLKQDIAKPDFVRDQN